MMLAPRRVFAACIVGVALLVTGCTRNGPANVSARGPCPSAYPAVSRRFSLADANSGVHGLDKTLVPFPAQQVRVCSYDSGGRTLTGTAVLNEPVAARLEASTNRLRTRTSQPTGPFACHVLGMSLLTFTTATKATHVVVADCGAGIASNGSLTVASTRTWLEELSGYTANQSKSG